MANFGDEDATGRGDKPSFSWRVLSYCVGLTAAIFCILLLMMPALDSNPEPFRRTACRNNLKHIGLALHNYVDVYGVFPPAYVSDEHGQPMHSWRVLILPYVDGSKYQAVYDQYDFNEPWDGPHNIGLLEKMPPLYRCPSHTDAEAGMTDYAAVVGAPCAMRGTIPVTIPEFADGLSQTIVVGEASRAQIRWTEPRDVSYGEFTHLGDPEGFSCYHAGVVPFLFADGSVQMLNSIETDEEVAKSLMTRAGED